MFNFGDARTHFCCFFLILEILLDEAEREFKLIGGRDLESFGHEDYPIHLTGYSRSTEGIAE